MERILSVTISLFLFLYAVEVLSFSFGDPLCSSHDSLALLEFKHSLNVTDDYYNYDCQSSYPKTASWNMTSMDCCRWDGVTCDSFTSHVIGLELSCSRLDGAIHPNSSLFQLRHLQKLDLSLNGFWGSQIPQGIGQLVSLTHLNLSYCWFQGRIPLEISHLSNLVSLDLSYISLQISEEGFNMLLQNLTKLELLSLSQVQLGVLLLGTECVFTTDSYFGNSELYGFPLSNECGQHKSASVPISSVEQEEDEPSFLSEITWQSVLIGRNFHRRRQ